jgi:RNA-directed DNA polymerase
MSSAEGRTEVMEADLSKYFDTIPHAKPMKCLVRRISDRRMLRNPSTNGV